MVPKVEGISMLSSEVHPLKQYWGIMLVLVGSTTEVSSVQSSKQLMPRLVIPAGSSTEVTALAANASFFSSTTL